MVFKKLSAFKFSSYLAYLLPLGATLIWGLWATAVMLVVVVAVGFLYHWFDEKRFLPMDAAAVCLIVVWNFGLCYAGQFKEPYFIMALLFTVLACYFYLLRQRRGSYSFNHGMWHLFGALITLFCILVFVP